MLQLSQDDKGLLNIFLRETLCPDGWEDGGDGGNGHCYIFLNKRDTYDNARNMWVPGLVLLLVLSMMLLLIKLF